MDLVSPELLARLQQSWERKLRSGNAPLRFAPAAGTRFFEPLGLISTFVEDHLRHAIRSARAAGHQVIVEPAKCRQCGFTFGEDKLSKPGKCPECRGTRLYEPQITIVDSTIG